MSNIWTIARRHVVLTVVLVAFVVSSGTLLAAARTASATLETPTITQEPADATDSGRAKFKLEHPRKDVTFECSLDGSPFAACHKNVQYQDPAPGQYCFRAKAVVGTLRSDAAEKCWTNMAPATFGVTGSVTGLYPGRTMPVDLELSNPHNQDIFVRSVTITVEADTSSEQCDGPENLTVTRDLQGPVQVPARSTKKLSELSVPQSSWPELTMPNLDENQDACKDTQFALTYTGTATK
ncbi:MAG: hypothetical protein KGZ72_11885 [Roseovarius sp.]|jgi:hypothetical protein|nr:hypothetical protein [Roseovarius sp.]